MKPSAPLLLFLQLAAPLLLFLPELAFSLCNTAFDLNLNITLATLRNHSSLSMYNLTQQGSGIHIVYGVYQCQGDVSLPECYNCVSQIVDKMTSSCPRKSGAMERDDKCFLRYDNYTFFDPPDNSFAYIAYNTANDTSETFRSNRDSALNKVISAAPQNRGYSASYAGQSVTNRVYALAQCLGYLTPNDCSQCLSQVSTYQVYMGDHAGGVVVFHSCSYRYDKYLFYNVNDTGISETPANSPSQQSTAKSNNTGISQPLVESPSQQSTANRHNTETRHNSKSATPIIVGATVSSSVTLVLCISLAIWRRKKTKHIKRDDLNRAEGDLNNQFTRFQQNAKLFTMDELKEATRNFHPDNKIGEGGFGPVFKGALEDGQVVAIKKLSAGSRQGTRQFLNEVSLITTVQHRNLIQLLGCCVDGSERLLVYEFLPKNSLDRHLFDSNDSFALDWHSRLEVIIGTAKGLAYLHEDSPMRIVHRDIKASNILLDDNFNAKIADFGMARLFPGDDTHISTGVAGTLGYLAPEYAMHGQLTEKADTFSFGLVCLEVVTGRRSIDLRLPPEQQRLLEWAWTLFKDQRQLELADPRLGGNFFAEEVVRVVHVALLCAQAQAGLRPAMSTVVQLLVGRSEILEMPTKPAYMLRDTGVGMEGNRQMIPSRTATLYVPPASSASSSLSLNEDQADVVPLVILEKSGTISDMVEAR